MPVEAIEGALADLRAGRMAIIAGGEDGEAHLCIAAEHVTPDAINVMATHARGLVCLNVTKEKLRALGIPLMVPDSPTGSRRAARLASHANGGISTKYCTVMMNVPRTPATALARRRYVFHKRPNRARHR